jgi:2-polyprenyl-3-methyl-5-hydroxy-6-metoxy-1,4-benzoquinol methylase
MPHRKLFIAYPMVLTMLLGSWFAAATPGADNSDTASVPPVPKTYRGREIAQTMHYLGAPWLIRESREREEQCATLLTALDIKAGDTVCDLGCGNGFYTLKLASLVGDQGAVLAVDIQQEMLGLLRARAESAEILNIRPILSTVDDSHLPTQQVDLLLLVDVYHEFSHPEAMLHAIHRS